MVLWEDRTYAEATWRLSGDACEERRELITVTIAPARANIAPRIAEEARAEPGLGRRIPGSH